MATRPDGDHPFRSFIVLITATYYAEDRQYLRYRRIIRHPIVIALLMFAMSYVEVGNKIRQQSKLAKPVNTCKLWMSPLTVVNDAALQIP